MNLTYTTVRSAKRKKLTITVERDSSILVLAPESATDEAIDRVVQSKRQWLFEKLQNAPKYQGTHAPGKEVVSGESALYLGREYRITLTDASDARVVFDRAFVIPQGDRLQTRQAFRDWYQAQAQEVILPRVQRLAFELGVDLAEAVIVDDRLRWGSCTAKNNVRLNWRLIKAPMSVIDYVIVHELAHLLENNHTPAFWNIVRAKVPGAEKSKAWLKEHGQILEEEI
ncbi:M48 family metallopeptidase [Limnohabitans sp.]|jgi:predicted metal-dependent hydrolase|uniref:M48 family metallopeptidase n=1 Tax=Limnohabitans sp. TaxID=1907725 RepID=UPI0037BF8C8F